MRLQTPPLALTDQYILAYCLPTDAVGDVVYITGDKIGERYQTTKIDIDDISTVPGIGIIVQKTAATECVVQVSGILRDVYVGLTPNKPLFAGLDARLTETPPSAPGSGRRAIQIIGQAIASSDLLIQPKPPIIRVAA